MRYPIEPVKDLDAYLARIGVAGPLPATAETLARLALAHPAAIPFENLDVLMDVSPSVEVAGVEAKLVAGGRGGYCFEHNTLLAGVLTALGFEVTRLAARVLLTRPDGDLGPRTHMLLRVALPDGDRLVDVGFGALTLTGVLRLEEDGVQATPHEDFRLVRLEGERRLEALVAGEWKPLYRFDLQPQAGIDIELANHYIATHPASPLRVAPVLARTTAEARYTVRNGAFVTRRPGQPPVERPLVGLADLRGVLAEAFGLRLPRSYEAGLSRFWPQG